VSDDFDVDAGQSSDAGQEDTWTGGDDGPFDSSADAAADDGQFDMSVDPGADSHLDLTSDPGAQSDTSTDSGGNGQFDMSVDPGGDGQFGVSGSDGQFDMSVDPGGDGQSDLNSDDPGGDGQFDMNADPGRLDMSAAAGQIELTAYPGDGHFDMTANPGGDGQFDSTADPGGEGRVEHGTGPLNPDHNDAPPTSQNAEPPPPDAGELVHFDMTANPGGDAQFDSTADPGTGHVEPGTGPLDPGRSDTQATSPAAERPSPDAGEHAGSDGSAGAGDADERVLHQMELTNDLLNAAGAAMSAVAALNPGAVYDMTSRAADFVNGLPVSDGVAQLGRQVQDAVAEVASHPSGRLTDVAKNADLQAAGAVVAGFVETMEAFERGASPVAAAADGAAAAATSFVGGPVDALVNFLHSTVEAQAGEESTAAAVTRAAASATPSELVKNAATVWIDLADAAHQGDTDRIIDNQLDGEYGELARTGATSGEYIGAWATGDSEALNATYDKVERGDYGFVAQASDRLGEALWDFLHD